MHKSKAVKILQRFSPEERKAFTKYLRSPFFNTNPTVLALYQLVERWILEKGKELSEEKAAEKLGNGAPISINLLRKLKSALLEHVVSFLAHYKLDSGRPGLRWRLALSEMNRLEALADFPKHYRQATKAFSTEIFENADVLEDKYHIEIQHGQYHNRLGTRRKGAFLDHLHQYLDQSYLLRKLRFACLSLNQRNIVHHDADPGGDAPIFRHFDGQQGEMTPLLRIYFLLRKCLAHENSPAEYDQLKELVQGSHRAIPSNELPDILTMILNHCARKVNSGATEFREETFEWYKWLLENGFLSEQGQILPQHAKNIVTLAAKTGKQEWVAHFLRDYGPKIKAGDEAQRRAYLTYLDASAAFHLHQYPRAASQMGAILNELEDVFFAIDARTILLRSHFENGNADGIENLCESFRIYLSRNSLISESHKVHFNAFIKYFRRFIQIPPMDHARLRKLRDELEEDRNVACHDWLLGKVSRLIGRIPGAIK